MHDHLRRPCGFLGGVLAVIILGAIYAMAVVAFTSGPRPGGYEASDGGARAARLWLSPD